MAGAGYQSGPIAQPTSTDAMSSTIKLWWVLMFWTLIRRPFLQRPAEVALFLACAQGVATRILNLLDLSSSAPMERYVFGFLACRAGDSPSLARQH